MRSHTVSSSGSSELVNKMANPYSGEVSLVIDGQEHVLKLTLGALAENDRVNLEIDVLARYLKRMQALAG